jgi:hypothetical protein
MTFKKESKVKKLVNYFSSSSFLVSLVLLITAVCALAIANVSASVNDSVSTDVNKDIIDTTLSVESLWQLDRIGQPVASPNGEFIVARVSSYAEKKIMIQLNFGYLTIRLTVLALSPPKA